MGDIYCVDCKYNKDDITGYENSCVHPSNIRVIKNYYRKLEIESKSQEQLNGDNRCKNYKRLWYKFWV